MLARMLGRRGAAVASVGKSTSAGRPLDDVSEYSIAGSDGKTVTFEGQLIASSHGSRADGSFGGRWHDLNVFKTVSGQYAVSIFYGSDHPTERSNDDVAFVTSHQELDDLLCLYQPEQFICPETLAAQPSSSSRQKLIDSVTRPYYRQVADILETVAEWEHEGP